MIRADFLDQPAFLQRIEQTKDHRLRQPAASGYVFQRRCFAGALKCGEQLLGMNNSFYQVGIARLRDGSHKRCGPHYSKKSSNLEFAMRNPAWDQLSQPCPTPGYWLAKAAILV